VGMAMSDEIKKFIQIVKRYSPNAFINDNNELIVVPKYNIYFGLKSVSSEMELKCKVIEWLSRASYKGISYYWQKRVRSIVNEYLETDFSIDKIEIVYTYLGNGCNRKLCEQFIESEYDLSLLKAV
jgi:hypothetical protein